MKFPFAWRHHFFGAAVTSVPLILFTTAVVVYIIHLGNYLAPRLAPVIAQLVAASVNRQVRVDRFIAFGQPGTAELQGLTVSNSATFATDRTPPAIQIEDVKVRYNLLALLSHPDQAASAIEAVDITKPTVYIERLASGSLNISDLLKQNPKSSRVPLHCLITVNHGKAILQDYQAGLPIERLPFSLSNVNASVDYSQADRISYALTANGPASIISRVSVKGQSAESPSRPNSINKSPSAFAIQVAFQGAMLDYAAPYLHLEKQARIKLTNGTASGVVDVRNGMSNGAVPAVSGQIHILGAAVSLVDKSLISQSIKKINIGAEFASNAVTFDGSGFLADQKVTVQGTVTDFSSPNLFVEADADQLDYQRFRRGVTLLPNLPAGLSLPGKIGVHAWITGTASSPSIDASVQAPSVIYDNYDVSNVNADISYQEKRVTIHSITLTGPAGVGPLSARGLFDFGGKTPQYQFMAEAPTVDLSKLDIPITMRKSIGSLSGIGAATIVGSNKGALANFAFGSGLVHNVAFDAVEGRASWKAGGPVCLNRLYIRQPGSGEISASGTVPTNNSGELSIGCHAVQLDLSKIGSAFTATPIRGIVYANGTISGSLTKPRAQFHLYGLQPGYGQYRADVVKADVTGTLSEIEIEKLQIRHLPGSASISGSVTDLQGHNPLINFNVSLDNTPVSYLATGNEDVGPTTKSAFPLTGFVDASATVTGSVAKPEVQATLSMTDGLIEGFQLSSVRARLGYANNVITVAGARCRVAGIAAVGIGSVDLKARSLDLNINASSDDISLLTHRYVSALKVTGGAQVAAHLFGSLSTPDATATLSSGGIAVEGTNFVLSPAEFSYHAQEVKLDNGPFTISTGDARYSLDDLKVDSGNKTIVAKGEITGESITHLLSVIKGSAYLDREIGPSIAAFTAKMPEEPYGELNVPSVVVSGSLSEPSISATANLTNAFFAGQKIDRLHTQFETHGSVFELASLQLTGPNDVYLEGKGTVDTNGAMNASIEASGFSLSLLKPYLPNSPVISGTLDDLTIVAVGLTKAPDVESSISLNNPTAGNFTIDRIDSGEIEIKNHRLTINGLTFTKEEEDGKGATVDHTVQIAGYLPFAWKDGDSLTPIIPHDQPMNLRATLPVQSMPFVSKLFPTLPVQFTAGTVAANLDVEGTLEKKQVKGSLNVVGAAFQPTGFQTGFSNVNIALSLSGQTFALTTLTATSSFGGSLSGSGGGNFGAAALADVGSVADTALGDVTLNLSFASNNLIVNERKIAVFDNAGAKARINGKVTVAGKLLEPIVNGTFHLDKVLASLPQESSAVPVDRGAPVFDPLFDITVDIEKGSEVKTAQLDAQADGSLKVSGSLYKPILAGTFLVRKGQFFFPTATFRVVPVGSVILAYDSSGNLEETIDMTATTTLSVSQALLNRNPAGVATATSYVPTLTPNEGSTSTRYDVTVSINGRLDIADQLKLTFSSNPPGLTDEQILADLGGSDAIAGLTGGNILGAVQDQVASVFNASVVPKLLQPFENSIGSVFGLSDFSVDYVPNNPIEVTIVKQLTPKISVKYVQNVQARNQGAVSTTLDPPEYQVQLGYSFTQRFQATLSTDDQHNTIAALEGVYKF